jgi:glutamate 5-kinase
VVVKVGSSSLAHSSGGIDDVALLRTVEQVIAVRSAGYRPILVSSGAVAAGLPVLGMQRRPRELVDLQVAAAVGQGRLMEHYARSFGAHDVVVGQVLLTRDVLAHRSQYLHARETLLRMLAIGVVPVVNENDTVVVDELKLGDNDRLAAMVGHLAGAGLLVLLTDTAGLFSQDPRVRDDAELLSAVRSTDEILDELYRKAGPGILGSGGVATKVVAARMAAWSGIPTVVADAKDSGAVMSAVTGADVGTWIEPRTSGLSARKLWIAFGLPAEGKVAVDAGAVKALVEGGRSLLPVGVVGVEGDFDPGSAVEIVDTTGGLVGKGIAGMGAAGLRSATGEHSSVAGGVVVHRDDLVVFQ